MVPHVQSVVLPGPPVQPEPVPALNWSHLKPQFVGKPDEDAEVHLLRTNDWMGTRAFPECVKVSYSSKHLLAYIYLIHFKNKNLIPAVCNVALL